jgi:hypothetical protein
MMSVVFLRTHDSSQGEAGSREELLVVQLRDEAKQGRAHAHLNRPQHYYLHTTLSKPQGA